jgi:hypothetical protein
MRDRQLRAILVSALRSAPDVSDLQVLRFARSPQLRGLLRWLDQSGLALYLLNHLQQHGVVRHIPVEFREALERRLKANRERTVEMLQEFGRIVESFQANGVRFCALKGFTLIPEFCPTPHLRHQTDFDFLVAPESVEPAGRALAYFGYARQESQQTDEVTFATPLDHLPSSSDDIYAVPRHREIDFLTTMRQVAHGVSINAPSDYLDRIQSQNLEGISFPTLLTEDMFCVQVMHTFKHLLGSWVRLSWLLEISSFIDRHGNDTNLWQAIIGRMGRDLNARNAAGLILCLANRVFPCSIPPLVADWCLRPLSPRIQTWVAQFGMKVALSDLEGAKVTLFVHREFVDDPDSWNSYVRSRIFPVGRRSSIGKVTTTGHRARMKVRASQWLHVMRRSVFHARQFVSLPVDALRWRYALRSIEKQDVLVSQALSR